MPAKSVAAKKTVTKAPAAKAAPAKAVTAKTAPAKTSAKKAAPAVKKPVAKPVANKNTKPVPAKPTSAKTVAAAKKPAAAKAPVKAATKPAAKPVVKSSAKTTAKVAAKTVPASKPAAASVAKAAPAKAPVVAKTAAPATKQPTAKPNFSVEDAVARVMNVVAKPEAANDKTVTDKPAAAPASAKAAVKTTPAPKPAIPKPAKNDNASLDYKAGDMVVYPAHGVGQVDGVETLTIGGIEVTLYTITFAKDRMRLKLPLQKIKTSGLRPLSTKEQMQSALQTMRGRARIKRVMWSRRAQEYEAKINSGSPVQVAEVLRDLRRNATGAENSYSERQIFQSALERLASELAAIEKIGEADAAIKLQNVLTEAA